MRNRRVTQSACAAIASGVLALAMNTSDAAETGQRVFANWCAPCHMDSPFAPGTIQLRQTRGPENAIIEQRTDLTEDLVRIFVRQGFAGMPKFRRTEISDRELDLLVEYLVRQ